MDGETRDEGRQPATADHSGEGIGRLAARAYRSTRVEIEDALRNGWLEIWYQPKIDLRNNSVVGAEALARIRHPELGVLLPGSFLPPVWESGLAHLSEHVLRAAMRDWSALDEAGFNLHLSVNIPLEALAEVPVAGLVAGHRPTAEHWPGLILEVTQGQIVRDFDLAQRWAKDLHGAKVSLSIDDFGSRLPWFSQWPEWAFAEVKIDGGFVKNCATASTNATMCQHAIDLAHQLGSVVVAKSIESGTDLQALRGMGCDFAQGVFIAPPLPMQGLLDLLRHSPSIVPVPSAADHPSPRPKPRGIDRVA
jgi:EAL domain-containing protein (putative c-di-GMP-specific phosphodiesterase class I)